MFVELINKNNIRVTLKKWSDGFWFFEVTREIEDENNVGYYNCTVLKRSFPVYNLYILDKILKGDKYNKYFDKKAKKLCLKYQDK